LSSYLNSSSNAGNIANELLFLIGERIHHLDIIQEFVELSATPIVFIDGPASIPMDTLESGNGYCYDGVQLMDDIYLPKQTALSVRQIMCLLKTMTPFIKMAEVDVDVNGKLVNILYFLT
jgi:hypothetical protein